MAAASAASNASATAGFRGPAKRAAFGDVTNMTKNAAVGNNDGKLVKPQSVTTISNNNNAKQPLASINKENNVPYSKDSLARTTQQPAVLAASKPKVAIAAAPGPDAAKKASAGVSRPKIAGESDRDSILPSVSRATFEAPALQPRHHKSQPQLSKLQQQQQQQIHVLRRTQSKQFERVHIAADSSIRSSSDLVSIPSQILEENLINEHEAYLDLPPYASDVQDPLPQVNHTDEYADLPLKLAHFSEEPQPVPASSIHTSIPTSLPATKENHTQALSEAEEYWDEEEDEYEDQDQGYTTAHSFRSRDLTTGGVTTLIAPRLTAKVQRELEEARIEVQETRLMDDVEEEMWDVSMVAEYGEEIFEYMRELEVRQNTSSYPFMRVLF